MDDKYGTIHKFDDNLFDNNLYGDNNVYLKNPVAMSRAHGEHGNMSMIISRSSDAFDKFGNRDIRLDHLKVFDYPKDSPYSCLLNIDGKEYYIRKMHRGEEDEDSDFDVDKDERGGGCYELIPTNLAASQRTHGKNITISGDALKRKLNNKDSNWEYTMYSTEKESDYNIESRYKNMRTTLFHLEDEKDTINEGIKILESKKETGWGLKLNTLKNKRHKLIIRLNKMIKIPATIIPNEKDIEKWIMREIF